MAMGLISLPVMMRYGYDEGATRPGVITAAGTLGQDHPAESMVLDGVRPTSWASRWATSS